MKQREMELTELIKHPERMDRDTLYELRSMLALQPYFQTARLLMLQNLYLLHDTAFDEELRRAAIYITDRKTIFKMVEAAHYQLQKTNDSPQPAAGATGEDRTVELIDTFLDSIPDDDSVKDEKPTKRQPTAADAAVDYVAYLMASESQDSQLEETPAMKGQDLIDNFLEQEQGRIMLHELQDQRDANDEDGNDNDDIQSTRQNGERDSEDEFFTETLARIYIKQGRYQKALDIIQRLSERLPNKNAYFADQIRFLEKLIINNYKNKK